MTGRRIILTLSLLMLMLLTSATAFGSDATPRKTEGAAVPLAAIGADPVMFKLNRLGGEPVELAALLNNKAVVLVFWSLFCGPCQEELPLVDQVYKKYADKDLAVFAVNLDGEKRSKAVEKYMEKQGFTFSVLWEIIDGVSYKTADAYGVAGTPTLIVIGKNGKVSFTHVGKTEAADLEKAVQEALAAK